MDIIGRIDALIDERHLLGHPFYQRWTAGTLPKPNLQEYARQYYAFESTFPRVLSALHARTEDPAARQSLLENLWDEEHGPENHAELWLRFAEAIGVAREDVRGATRNPATTALVETYRRAAAEVPVPAGVAAVYAYERQVPEIAGAKIDGLRRWFGVQDAGSLAFFSIHAGLDVEHSEAEREIVARGGQEEAVQEATSEALDAWWAFLDAVNEDLVGTPAA